MKKSSRYITLIIVLALLVSVFAGCSSSSDKATPSPSTSESAAPSPDATQASAVTDTASTDSTVAWPENALGTVSLPLTDTTESISLWMGINPNVLKLIDDPNSDCAIWAELAKRTNVNIEFVTVHPDTEGEKFNLMVASGDLTDVISNATTLYPNGGEAAVAEGVVMDMLPYLTEENAPQICKLLDQNPTALENGLTESGYLAGLPQLSQQTEATSTFGPLIRKDWLDKVGMEIPETYDELYEVLKAFRDQLGADAPLTINYAGTGLNNGLVQGYGVLGLVADKAQSEPFYLEDGQLQFGPIQPEFKDYLTMINKWYSEGLIWEDFMSFSDFQNPPTDLILADRCGMFYGEVTFIATLKKSSSDPDFELVAMPDLVLNKGDKIPFKDEFDYMVATPWSVSTSCDCPDLVMKWCNYLYTDDGALLSNYGIEDKSFELDDNGQPAFTDLVLNNADMSTTVALFMYCMDRGPFYRDEAREQSGYTEAQKEASSIWNSNLDTGKSPGAYTLNADESDQVNVKYPDIKTYVSEMVLKYIVGNESLDNFDTYTQTVKDNGIGDVIAVRQAAYERYLIEGSSTTEAAGGDKGAPPDGAPAP